MNLTLTIVALYFLVLFAISRWTVRRKGAVAGGSNDTFFRAGRRSPWYMVAFGMVGASISGITFVSVPGMVLTSQMTYLQLCLGFILGYVAVAYVLLPVYYRLGLTSIYSYLGDRLGRRSHQTGTWFFLLSKLLGSSLKFYVVCIILQQLALDALGVPFALTVVVMVALIWLYTRRGGVGTLVFTDTFQTFCLFTALLLIIYKVVALRYGGSMEHLQSAILDIAADSRTRILELTDWQSPHYFWKQLLSGIFIVVVMTGLDQDMMQKNLTCRTLREAQKNMCSYGVAFLPANLLFLALGVLLAQFFESQGIALPALGDELLPQFVHGTANSQCSIVNGQWSMFSVQSLFVLGIVAASFSSADSALTSLTTSYCVDIRRSDGDERLRKRTHLAVCLLFAVTILVFHHVNSRSLIDAIYTIVSYTYGPLLGLFAFGLFTPWSVRDRWVPLVCVASPIVSHALSVAALSLWGYHFGYELLLLNGLLAFLGLCLFKKSLVRPN
ncbi:MAG: sodium:solute symporter [Prevotella sp.]|nr:sodium:solute symporter [Prevotella sp.]